MADRAKRGLWEKGGGELMALDMVDLGLFDGSSAVMQSKEALSLKFTHVLCVCRKKRGDTVTFCAVFVLAGWGPAVTLPRAQRKHTAARRSWPRPRHVMETPACQANNTINEKQQKSPSSLKQDNEINDYNFQNCNSQYSEDSYITYSVSLTFTLQNMEV